GRFAGGPRRRSGRMVLRRRQQVEPGAPRAAALAAHVGALARDLDAAYAGRLLTRGARAGRNGPAPDLRGDAQLSRRRDRVPPDHGRRGRRVGRVGYFIDQAVLTVSGTIFKPASVRKLLT